MLLRQDWETHGQLCDLCYTSGFNEILKNIPRREIIFNIPCGKLRYMLLMVNDEADQVFEGNVNPGDGIRDILPAYLRGERGCL